MPSPDPDTGRPRDDSPDTTEVSVHQLYRTIEALYAFGGGSAPRGARPGDFDGDPAGPYAPTSPLNVVGGVSVFTDPLRAPLTGHYWVLPAGTPLPPGLALHLDGEDVGGHAPWGHRTMYPTVRMSVDECRQKFQGLPWELAGRKKR